MVGLGLAVFAFGALAVAWAAGGIFGKAPYTGLTATVVRERLKITITARGTLESAKNNDIVCRVKSGAKGANNSTSIKWLIDNGAEVEEGDVIMELDDSGLKEQLKSQNITVDGAKADEVKAAEQYRIDDIDYTTKVEAAVNKRDLAKLDLEKYSMGDFVQALKDVDGRTETSRSDLEQWKDRAAWSARMLKKNLMSKVQADADDSRVDGARITLERVQEERRVLVDYTKKRTTQDLTAKQVEAGREIEKNEIQKKAQLALDKATHSSKKSIYDQELAKKQEIIAEIAKCTIKAPQSGLVVYVVPEQVRGGAGGQQSIVAQGESVREGQKMMQIPDLKKMLVNVRVPEAFVSHLHSEDPDDKSTRQAVQMRLDALPNVTLTGRVKTVDTVASAQDFFASDVKVYKTIVKIDGQPDGLKPGMSADVTIYADESPNDVLVVPVQAVIGSISMGAKRQVYVIGADGQPVRRDIVVGMTNERKVEVRSGLEEGERVVENPTPLLRDEPEMKAGKIRAKTESDDHGDGDGGQKKKGEKKKKSASPSDGPGSKGFGGAAPSPQELQQMREALLEKARPMSAAQRRELVNGTPEAYRPQVQQLLRDNNLDVAE